MAEGVFASLREKIDPAHSAVVVVDMQNDFCVAGGVLDQHGFDLSPMQSMIPRLKDFLEQARKRGLRIIFIRTEKGEEDITPPTRELMRRKGRKRFACRAGTWGAEFVEGIRPGEDELVVEKKRYSAFVGTDLETRLRERGIQTLVMTGVATNVCVDSTAREAFFRDFHVVFASDLSATDDPVLHQATLTNIEKHFGQVVSAQELLREWQAVEAGAAQK
ncbi:MAG: cysteine hydrolase family protein [Dehalococcoidia bacterium]